MYYRKKLERNLWLYKFRGIFERRPYLPVITIYATSVAGITLTQIGIIASITSLVSLVAEIPSGYLSDKFGHKKSLLFGSFLMTISALSYVIWPSFFGACLAMVLFWLGVAFHSGTLTAFVHETLLALKRDDDFVFISSQERRYAMLGNIILVGLVPLSYQLSPVLPFIIGFVLHFGSFISYYLMVTPQKTHLPIKEALDGNFFHLLTSINNRGEIILFIFLGIIGASFNVLSQFRELYFQAINIPLKFFGFILSITGIVTIFLTYIVPYFKKIKPIVFFGLDFFFVIFATILIGLNTHPVIGILLFVLFGSYRRIRFITFHYHLLKGCPTQRLKATYLSVFAFFTSLSSIFIPLLLGFLIGHFSINNGYLLFGIILFAILSPLYLLIYNKLAKLFA